LGKYLADVVSYGLDLRSRISTRPARAIFDNYNFPELSDCFDILDKFLTWTENRKAVMSTVWPTVQTTLDELALLVPHNGYADQFIRAVHKRFDTSADLGLIFLGYVLTPREGPGTGSFLSHLITRVQSLLTV
jgi:hypothetical protein